MLCGHLITSGVTGLRRRKGSGRSRAWHALLDPSLQLFSEVRRVFVAMNLHAMLYGGFHNFLNAVRRDRDSAFLGRLRILSTVNVLPSHKNLLFLLMAAWTPSFGRVAIPAVSPPNTLFNVFARYNVFGAAPEIIRSGGTGVRYWGRPFFSHISAAKNRGQPLR